MKFVSIRVPPWGFSHPAKSRKRHIFFPRLLINSMLMTKWKRKSRRTKLTPRNFYLGLRVAPKIGFYSHFSSSFHIFWMYTLSCASHQFFYREKIIEDIKTHNNNQAAFPQD